MCIRDSINTSWGGTRVEAWTSLEKLRTLNATKDIISNLDLNTENNKKVNYPNAYSILFKKMLSPVLPYNIRGAIWYQGEANVGNYEEYNELFPAMIEDWREKWGYDFPFYYVQIAPFNYEDGKLSYELRDVQRKSLKTKNTGMVVTMDIGEANDIHPANKQDVGNRLALLALDNAIQTSVQGTLLLGPHILGDLTVRDFSDSKPDIVIYFLVYFCCRVHVSV